MKIEKCATRFVLILALGAVATLSRGDSVEIEIRPNAANYMVFYDRLRAFRTLEIVAEGLVEAAVAQAEFDEASYQRNLRMASSLAVPEEELRISDMTRKVSVLSIKRYRHDAAANAAEIAAHAILLRYIQGQSISVADVYQGFQRAWGEQCSARRHRLGEAEAQRDLANFRLTLVSRLAQDEAVTMEELQLRQSRAMQAGAEVNASRRLVATCHEDEPSLVFLEDMMRRE